MKNTLLRICEKFWPPAFFIGSEIFIVRYFRQQAAHLEQPAHLDWRYLALGVALQLGYWMINALCWRSTVLWYGGIRLSLLESFRQLAMSTLGKYFPGKIWGMVARASSLGQMGMTARQSLYATLSEQFLILYAAGLTSAVLWYMGNQTAFSLALALASIGGVTIMPTLQAWGFKWAPHFLKQASDPAQGPKDGCAAMLPFKKIAGLLLAYCIIWLLIGSIFCCVYYLFFPVQPSLQIAIRLIVANAIGISIGFFAIFSPGGLGVREAITSSLLATQIGLEQAILLCLLFRLWIVAWELLSGTTLLVPHKNSIAE